MLKRVCSCLLDLPDLRDPVSESVSGVPTVFRKPGGYTFTVHQSN